MNKKLLFIIGFAASLIAACQTTSTNKKADSYHKCIVMKCGSEIDKCKTIAGILTPFCDKHIEMIRNNKVLDVCSGCYKRYVDKCKELTYEK